VAYTPGAASDLDRLLAQLQLSTVRYYLRETNPDNGLVRDKTDPNAPVSIAAVGMALATMPVVVERGVLVRGFAAKITLKRLRYLLACAQGPQPDATGYKGFFYHFLDIHTGRRVWECELSTIDSAFLFAGALTVGTYFDRDTPDEVEIRNVADTLYRRADWNWARDGGPTLTHGWRPESGFIQHRWQGYDEGLLLYILGLGSPTHPLPPESYRAYCATYTWKKIYDRELLYSGRSSHINSRICGSTFAAFATNSCGGAAATTLRTAGRRRLCSRNTRSAIPGISSDNGEHCWGFTACDGPSGGKRVIDGVEREFFDYIARGAPFGPDDGTVAPWVVVASLPFAPEIVVPTVKNFARMDAGMTGKYGFKPSFNQTFAMPDSLSSWWVTPYYFGIDQGPVVLMIENYLTGLLWKIMRRCPAVVAGLRRAGFSGGWL
jgi:hypothetical protein